MNSSIHLTMTSHAFSHRSRKCPLRLGALMLLLATTLCSQLSGADKSGVAPNSISLPKGPGSIEGLGESFQPTLNTGTAKHSLGIKVPPGTAGHQPVLSLSYEGGGGNGPLGYGWGISLPSIQRRTDKGIPTYGQPLGVTRPDTFINDAREELVPASDGFFFCENETSFIRYEQVGNHWEGTTPDGTRLEFGITTNGRIAEATRIFSWLLERQTDTHGNVIEYAYTAFPGGQNLNQKYLSQIRYGAGAPPWSAFHFIVFDYEERPDWFEDGRAGFLVRTGKRLSSIRVGTQGVALANHRAGDFNHDGVADVLNRRYELEYLRYAGSASHWSLLAKVTVRGADGSVALPPATFDYAVSAPAPIIDASSNVWTSVNAPSAVMDNPQVELIDLNADGLPDLLKTEAGGGGHTVALNRGPVRQGNGWAIRWADPVAVDPGIGASWNFDLASERTHLADMDGDGLADLVHKTADDAVFYFANRGHLGWGGRRDMVTLESAPPAPFGNPSVRTADIDFDKRIDIIQSIEMGGSVGYRVWFNLGDERYSAPNTVEPEGGFDFALPGVQLVDCNGDRIPDVARIQPGAVTVAAGLGYGRFAAPQSLTLPDFTLDELQIANAKLTDINGDGLADLVLERATPGVCWYWLNLGNYTFDSRRVLNGLPGVSVGSAVRWADLNGNGTTDLIYGDGTTTPRLRMIECGQLLNGGLAPNLLIRLANGVGRVSTIEYASSTRFALEDEAAGRPWPDPLPFPVTVVASVTVSDSLGHEYTTRYRYHDGYYEPREKQFRGFGEVEQIEEGDTSAPTLVSRSHFDTGWAFDAMKGRLLQSSSETEDGAIFSRETTTWADPPRLLRTGTNGLLVRFAHPVASVKEILERGMGTPRRLESEVTYDDFGNATRLSDYGIVEGSNRSAFDDERITVTEFALNLSKWIVRKPRRQVIQDENGVVLSRSESFYDDESFSGNNPGGVSVGNLTLRRDWSNAADANGFIKAVRTRYDAFGNPIMLLDPLADGAPNPTQGHYRELTYDESFHACAVRETIHVGQGKAPLAFQVTYDLGLGTIETSTDFNGNSTVYGHDALGRLVHIIKPGDMAAFPTSEYSYELAVAAEGGVAGQSGFVNYVETRALDRTPGTTGAKREHYHITRQFIDGLGRTLMTRTEAEPAPGTTASRVVVTDAVQFNARQSVARTLNPFFTSRSGSLEELLAFENIEAPGWNGGFQEGGGLVSHKLATAHASMMEYDASSRRLRTLNADGTARRTDYEPLVTRIYDENDTDPASAHFDTPLVRFTDGLGRLIRVDELVRLNDDGTPASALKTWTTRYAYDLNNLLTRITDSQNNVKLMRYDGLKRRVEVNDPDAGISTHTYDDAFNLVGSIDAKGQRLSFTYDGANRVLTEDYHDDTAAGFSYRRSPDVTYVYDEPLDAVEQGDGTRARARNTKGLLAYVEDASGEEHTSFDGRGRVEWTVRRISDPQVSSPDALVSYKTAFAYDAMDRLTRLTYPDNDQVSYEYNSRALLERISGGPAGGLIPAIRYIPSAQQNQVQYGNGVRTTFGYDARLRLTSLATERPSTGAELMNFAYSFDAVSNMKQIVDQRSGLAVPDGDPRRNTQTFAYDELYRLTLAEYSASASALSPTKHIRYRYDRIGNMLAQTSDIVHFEKGQSVADVGSMSYGGEVGAANRFGRQPNGPPGPHALTSVEHSPLPRRLYPYDANGNMTEIDGLRCTWDFKDRLVVAEDNTMRAEYIYNYANERVLKKIWQKPTGASNAPVATPTRPSSSVIYVGREFEVRPQEQPVKYVFNGETRVARVTGSLSTRARIQRLRLHPGWNLVALAVTASNALEQLARVPSVGGAVGSLVEQVYRWNPSTGGYSPLNAGQTLPAGSVLWLKSSTNMTVALTGAYVDPTNRTIVAGTTLEGGAGLETLSRAGWSGNVALWHFDPFQQTWQSHAPSLPGIDPLFPEFLSPGCATVVRADAPAELRVPEQALRVRYYHPDHLGSAGVMTDNDGALIEETAYYPFGAARNEYRSRRVEEGEYKFTQKEQDAESGLSYFGSRFLSSQLSHFVRVDSLALQLPGEWLERPQKLNSYAYVQNNPLRFVDPTGMDAEKPKPSGQRVLVLYSEDLFKDFANHNPGRDRDFYQNALKETYALEAGAGANITVKSFRLKSTDDLQKYFKGSAYDVVIYNGHGSSLAKEIFPDGDVRVTPEDLKDALAGARAVPKQIYLYGCNTAKTGFARVLSDILPKTTVTGSGNYIAQSWKTEQTRRGQKLTIEEDRNHNIIYNGGNETKNVRKVDPKELENAGIR